MSKHTTVNDGILLNMVFDNDEYDELRTAISNRVMDANDTGLLQGFCVASVLFIGMHFVRKLANVVYYAIAKAEDKELGEIRKQAYAMDADVDKEHIS